MINKIPVFNNVQDEVGTAHIGPAPIQPEIVLLRIKIGSEEGSIFFNRRGLSADDRKRLSDTLEFLRNALSQFEEVERTAPSI